MLTPEELNKKCPYITDDELEFMRDRMSKMIPSNANIVMIGAGPGMLIFSLLDSEESENWKITIIDLDSIQWAKAHYGQAKSFVASYVGKITWIEGYDSYDIGMKWNGGSIDLLIIDGDHTERGVRRDMQAWLPHVSKNGIVFHHDYLFAGTRWDEKGREIYPETQPFVDEVMNADEWESVWRGGCSKVLKKI